MSPNPTVVVGVGQAGLNVLSTLDSVIKDKAQRDYYRLIALDSDQESLQGVPPDATCLALPIDEDVVQQDQSKYPYLTQTMEVPIEGTARQRPLGRYALDNQGVPTFDTIFRELREDITDHFTRYNTNLGPTIGSFNIFLVNSLGGGTGSGMYPLLLGMLDEIKGEITQDYKIDIYLSAVGIVPETTSDIVSISSHTLSDEATFLINAYAALSDLDNLNGLSANKDESVSIPVYSRMYGSDQHDSPDEIRLDKPPFEDYWLIGVDESEIAESSSGSIGFESHQESVNTQTVRLIQAIGKCNARQFPPGIGGRGIRNRAYTGGFKQTEIEVPHERVKKFVELKAERDSVRSRITEEIPEQLDELYDKRKRLETLKQDPISDSTIDDDSIWNDVQSHIDQRLDRPTEIDEHNAPNEIDTLLDEVQETNSLEGVIIAVDILDKEIHDSGLSAVEESRAETIQELWKKYDVDSKNELGGGSARTLDKKANAIRESIQIKIEEYTDVLEDWDPNLLEEIRDATPPVFDTLESDREMAEKALKTLKNDLDRLNTIEADWTRISKLEETLNDRRTDIRYRIDDRITGIENEITELLDERDQCEAKVDELTRHIETEREHLVQPHVSGRLAVLPIIPEQLDQIDLDTINSELDSLADYLDQGLIRREEFKAGLNRQFEFCRAWESSLMDRNFAKTNDSQSFQAVDELWILFHEANGELLNQINTTIGANLHTSGERSLKHLPDSYRIEFVSFTHQGPISSFTFYQQLEEIAEEGHLDATTLQYEDYRYAFAYPEWYGRYVQPHPEHRVTLDRPPELEPECIDMPDLDEGELKNFIKTTGLNAYLWQGHTWEHYVSNEGFSGWKHELTQQGLTFIDLQRASPNARMKAQWLAGEADWTDILTAVQNNIMDQNRLEIVFDDPLC